MNKNGEKADKGEQKKEEEKKVQINLRVFEEDDYFEEFEEGNYIKIINYFIDKLRLEKIKSEEMRQWQANWEDEEVNDNFENLLKQELNANKGKKATVFYSNAHKKKLKI